MHRKSRWQTLLLLLIGVMSFCLRANATCSVPNTIADGQTADASPVGQNFSALSGCLGPLTSGPENSVVYKAGDGTIKSLGPLLDGQLIIGGNGVAPVAATVTPGSGISVTNAPGSVTISGSTFPYTAPRLANFTLDHAIAGATLTDTGSGIALFVPPNPNNSLIIWSNQGYPATPATSTIGVRASLSDVYWASTGLFLGDATGKMVRLYLQNNGGTLVVSADYWNNSNFVAGSAVSGPAISGNIIFLRVVDDGTNLNFSWGSDLNSMVPFGSVSRTAWLASGPTRTGIGVIANTSSAAVAANIFHSSFGN